MRPRLAIFSVLPPTRSGVAIYTERLVRALAEEVDVTCFFAGDRPEGIYPSTVEIRETRTFDASRDAGSFDALIYSLGNNALHSEHIDLALSCPGVVLLHEPRLVNARRAATAGGRGDEFLCADVCRAALKVCVHSYAAARIVSRESDRTAIMVGPLAVPVSTRRPTERRLVVSAGIVSMVKRADILVEAFAHLWRGMPQMRLAFVGPCGPDERKAVLRIAMDHGVGHRVLITGEVSDHDYSRLVGSASVAIQLRANAYGESSAAVNDAIAAGVPTIVSDIGSFAEFPDSVVAKVPPETSALAVSDVITRLSSDETLRTEMIAASSTYAVAQSFAVAAGRLIAAVLP